MTKTKKRKTQTKPSRVWKNKPCRRCGAPCTNRLCWDCYTRKGTPVSKRCCSKYKRYK